MGQFTDRQIEIMEAATARIDQHGIQNLTIKTLAADLGLSEPALYRHFESKNAILLSVLHFFTAEMEKRLSILVENSNENSGDLLRSIFKSQLQTFTDKPAVVSVIFAENIFHYDEKLSHKVSEIMDLMHRYVHANIENGQKAGHYSKLIGASTLTTIILGSMRLTVLKWKLSGHTSNLMKDGMKVLEGVLKMIEKN